MSSVEEVVSEVVSEVPVVVSEVAAAEVVSDVPEESKDDSLDNPLLALLCNEARREMLEHLLADEVSAFPEPYTPADVVTRIKCGLTDADISDIIKNCNFQGLFERRNGLGQLFGWQRAVSTFTQENKELWVKYVMQVLEILHPSTPMGINDVLAISCNDLRNNVWKVLQYYATSMDVLTDDVQAMLKDIEEPPFTAENCYTRISENLSQKDVDAMYKKQTSKMFQRTNGFTRLIAGYPLVFNHLDEKAKEKFWNAVFHILKLCSIVKTTSGHLGTFERIAALSKQKAMTMKDTNTMSMTQMLITDPKARGLLMEVVNDTQAMKNMFQSMGGAISAFAMDSQAAPVPETPEGEEVQAEVDDGEGDECESEKDDGDDEPVLASDFFKREERKQAKLHKKRFGATPPSAGTYALDMMNRMNMSDENIEELSAGIRDTINGTTQNPMLKSVHDMLSKGGSGSMGDLQSMVQKMQADLGAEGKQLPAGMDMAKLFKLLPVGMKLPGMPSSADPSLQLPKAMTTATLEAQKLEAQQLAKQIFASMGSKKPQNKDISSLLAPLKEDLEQAD